MTGRRVLFVLCCVLLTTVMSKDVVDSDFCRRPGGSFKTGEPGKSFIHERKATGVKSSMNVTKVNLTVAQEYCTAFGGKLPELKTVRHMNNISDPFKSGESFFFGYMRDSSGSGSEYLSLTKKDKLPKELKDLLKTGSGSCISHNTASGHTANDELMKFDCDNSVDFVVCEIDCNEQSWTLGRTVKLSIRAETKESEPCTDKTQVVCELEQLEPKTNAEVKKFKATKQSRFVEDEPTETPTRKVFYQKPGYVRYDCEAKLYILGLEINTTKANAFIQCESSKTLEIESTLHKLEESQQTANEEMKAEHVEMKEQHNLSVALTATTVAFAITCALIVVPILILVFLMCRGRQKKYVSPEDAGVRKPSTNSNYSSRLGSLQKSFGRGGDSSKGEGHSAKTNSNYSSKFSSLRKSSNRKSKQSSPGGKRKPSQAKSKQPSPGTKRRPSKTSKQSKSPGAKRRPSNKSSHHRSHLRETSSFS